VPGANIHRGRKHDIPHVEEALDHGARASLANTGSRACITSSASTQPRRSGSTGRACAVGPAARGPRGERREGQLLIVTARRGRAAALAGLSACGRLCYTDTPSEVTYPYPILVGYADTDTQIHYFSGFFFEKVCIRVSDTYCIGYSYPYSCNVGGRYGRTCITGNKYAIIYSIFYC